MKTRTSWWAESGRLLTQHPELITAAQGVCGFGGGAEWMHGAMKTLGWRVPPFRQRNVYAKLGWLKYGICIFSASLSAFIITGCGMAWLAPILAIGGFYATEAQMVFLFPEVLLGRRAPWGSSRALTVSAGGTFQVMAGVLPIAVRMLACGWWRGRGLKTWIQGCLAVVIWHRHVAMSRRGSITDEKLLPLLEIGPVAPLLLRRVKVAARGREKFRVMWISDLHWRGAGDAGSLLAMHYLVRSERPDVCILGGDFIERAAALPLLSLLVRSIVRVAPCVALPGNHDRGRFVESVPNAIRAAGGQWLPDSKCLELTNTSGDRLEIVTRCAKEIDKNITRVVAVHDPAELDQFPPAIGSLVMAGHLHGGQWVFSSNRGRLLPAAWFYRHAWLRRTSLGAEWIVSRGTGDTFPVRWNCPREVVLCEIS